MRAGAEEPQKQAQPPASTQSPFRDAFTTRRSLRQLGLFCAGATFFTAATFITRRQMVRRFRASIPPFYHPSNLPYGEANGAMEAFEALNLATVNVVSAAIMLTGGTMWALDISTLEDLRKKVRHRVGSGDERKSDEEIEEWIAEVLARKDMKEAVKAATGIKLEQLLQDAKEKNGEQSSGSSAR
ncbi:hypothetical protein MPH_11005 [Macrophomina phaseolina MS6]|uniref:Altered inheritance of mitochondria protein 11 n=2 Tax=Macrophomina phaseolina TaxID=35725 RepID=K2RBD7_MACPH|nr:hypothetical protein MPH_11005 [Macrophomina phaseolina MS6]KAH7057397.1 hypothetical protein B0J12DRAFT_775235 [Macrophomina phaseolina]